MKEPQLFEEKTFKIDPIFHGKIISLQVEYVTLPNGETSKREIVKHPGAVAVLVVKDEKLLVVEQYRKALSRSLVEIPAGKLDPGEDPVHAAARELKEETGFSSEQLNHVYSFYTSPGFADELIHLYVAEGLTEGERELDEDEFLELSWITESEADAYIADGRIRDAKTIIAIQWWKMNRLIKAGE